MIRGIVFDLFDTLVDQNHDRLPWLEHEGRRMSPTTSRLHLHTEQRTGLRMPLAEFADRQREVDRALYDETLKLGLELPTQRRFEALTKRLDLASFPELARELTGIHMGMLREAASVPGNHEAILASLAVEHRLGLCSNFSHAETARAILEEAGFTPHLSALVISEEFGIRKPRAEIFDAVVEMLELAPHEILHVGDNLKADVGGAAACGMRTVWLTRQVADPDARLGEYEGPPPDFALEDLSDLPVLVARLSI